MNNNFIKLFISGAGILKDYGFTDINILIKDLWRVR